MLIVIPAKRLVLTCSALAIMFSVSHFYRLVAGVRRGVTLEGIPLTGMTQTEVRALVEGIARGRTALSRNAGLDKSGKVIAHRVGQAVDIEATVRRAMGASRGAFVEVVTYEVQPEFTTEDIKALKVVLGAYRTSVGGSEERAFNVALAASILNNTLVYPGEVFSFNKSVGPFTASRGFRPAPVIVQDQLQLGPGGGVCQVASTLYNACLLAGLTIVERHAHSRPVRYVPPGRDATVADGSKDFKFRNDYPFPVIIKAGSVGRRLSVWFLGARKE